MHTAYALMKLPKLFTNLPLRACVGERPLPFLNGKLIPQLDVFHLLALAHLQGLDHEFLTHLLPK